MCLTEMKAQNKFAYDRIQNSLVYALEPAKNPDHNFFPLIYQFTSLKKTHTHDIKEMRSNIGMS